MDKWIPYKELDWDNLAYTAYHIDTRDFNGIANDYAPVIEFVKRKAETKPEEYFFTKEQIFELLDRYYKESGGPGSWRMLTLEGDGKKHTSGWELKYIRIYRTKYGFIVGNRATKEDHTRIFSKKILNSPVSQKHLNHH